MNAVAATPDGAAIVAGGQDGVLRVWNGKDGKAIASLAPHHVK
jgi:WD40 repeat protein